MTNIEWADETVQIVAGCNHISPGCDHCYALRDSWRLAHNPTLSAERRMAYAQAVKKTDDGPEWTGEVVEMPGWRESLARAAKGRPGKRIFVESMGDLFHEKVPFNLVDEVITMAVWNESQRFLLLTKRPARMREYFESRMANDSPWAEAADRMADHFGCAEYPAAPYAADWPLRNVWLGVTVCNRAEADAKIPVLLETPAAVRFISMEPLLGPIDLTFHIFSEPTGRFRTHQGKRQVEARRPPDGGLHWIIAGGETGPGARPMHPDWVRSIRDQCVEAGVPFFFKGWGDWLPGQNELHPTWEQEIAHHQNGKWGADRFKVTPKNYVLWDCNQTVFYGEDHYGKSKPLVWARRVSRKAAGRKLDGREWNEIPEAQP